MRRDDNRLEEQLKQRLDRFASIVHALPGIDDDKRRSSFIFQLIESIRRIRYIGQIAERPIANARKDPNDGLFDPIRAAMLYQRENDIDEACWLVFLFTHFGKNAKSNYRLISDVYGNLNEDEPWTWDRVSIDPLQFRRWLDRSLPKLTSCEVHRGFGNHRKYQSLDAWKPVGTGEAVATYVAWVKEAGDHRSLFTNSLNESLADPEKAFANLYRSMNSVRSFGRTARFDYLAMIGKLRLAEIRPDSVHLQGATGPAVGARLLFFGATSAKCPLPELENLSDELGKALEVDKQAIEDSLCNWQKSPDDPMRFRG